MGAVNVINAGHLGGAGYHASMAAEQGCVGHVMATSGESATARASAGLRPSRPTDAAGGVTQKGRP